MEYELNELNDNIICLCFWFTEQIYPTELPVEIIWWSNQCQNLRMGNWKLELGKMAIYMAFPVTSFYVYHQVDWFEDQIADMHRKVRSKESITNKMELQECVEMMRSHRDKQFKEELAKMKSEISDIKWLEILFTILSK